MKLALRNALVVSVIVAAAMLVWRSLPQQPDAERATTQAQSEPASGDVQAVEPAAGNIEGVTWTAVEMNGKPLAAGVVITLALDDGRIAGRSACNRYTGPYAIDTQARSLTVTGPVAGTRMACPPEVMEVENTFNTLLPKITAYRVDAGPVLVIFAQGDEVLRLHPQAAE